MASKTAFTASKSSKRSVNHIPILQTQEFFGLQNYPKPQQIPRGAAQDALNFITRETWVETRPGYHPLGAEVAGSGQVLGLFTAHDWDGNEIPFRATLDGKLQYFNGTTWNEVGSNILAAAAAAGENVYMDEYFSPAGAQLWVSSPSSDLIKIMTANPSSYLSQYNASKNFKGRIRIIQNSLFLWHYRASTVAAAANAVLQRSYIDSQIYTSQTDSAVTLSTTTTSVSGTLSKNSVANATVFATVFAYTDGAYTEQYVDDFQGNLIGANGGTGTINYSTGAFTITLPAAHQPPSVPVVNCTYEYEDSTNGGLADFTKDSTRKAGQGVAWIQNSGGDILGVDPYNGSYYVLHERNAWVITPSQDDTAATNIIYRENMALSSERGSVSTAEGIYYIDVTNASRPFIGRVSFSALNDQVLPDDISSTTLDLTDLIFDQAFAMRALDFIMFFCRTPDSTANNRCILLNIKLSTSKKRVFDILDYFATSGAIYSGQVIVGDPLSNNAFKLFDGFDDDDAIPNAYWIGNEDDHQVAGLKQTKKLWAEGYIAVNQSVDVYVSLDGATAVKVGTITGQGAYVDQGQPVTIGSLQIGVYPIGGPSSEPVAFHYLTQITINSSKYKYFTIKFQPTAIGYFSFQMYANYDIRINVDKLPSKNRDVQSQIKGGVTPASGLYTETPQGLVDGVNTVYTLSHEILFIYNLQINGQFIGSEYYTTSGKQITFLSPLDSSLTGTVFEMSYLGGT